MTSWTVTVEEDSETGDLVLPFPPELLAQLGWNEGDTLLWGTNSDGSFYISKKVDEGEIS